jgi:hypothetical protein
MIGTTGYKLNPEKLASARRELLPYLFSNFYYTEEFEYFDAIKPYLKSHKNLMRRLMLL